MIPQINRRTALAVAVCLLAVSCSGSGDVASPQVTVVTTEAPVTTVTVAIPTTTSTSTAPPTTTATATTITPAPLGLLPLTGLPGDDEAVLNRPVIAAKIDNIEGARPQAGLVQADVVFEEVVEGGLTRLLAIFHSQDAEVVGPIRSARSTDVPLLTPLREPIFAWSGANSAFAALIRSVAIRDIGVEAVPGAYTRAADRSSPSNLMTSTADLYAQVDLEGDHAPNPLFDHLLPGEPSSDGETIAGVEVDYGATTVTHVWDADLSGWARTQNGTPHVDADGDVIAPENVIVQFVTYRNSGLVDSSGAVVPEAELSGDGVAWFLSNGQIVEGTWTKPNVTASSQYLDNTGEPVLLTPGRTWVLLARADSAALL